MGTYDPMPVNGQTADWGTWLRDAISGLDARASSLEAGSSSGTGGIYYVDDQSGANDDVKFDNALAAARNANGYTGTVVFSNRLYTLNSQHTLQSGDQITGLPGSADEPRGSGNKNRIQCNYNGSVFVLSGSTPHSIYIGNLQFQGTSNTIWLAGSSSVVLWTSVIENVGFSLFKHVLGTPAQQLLLTACTLKGYWNVNNGYDQAFTVGGSDVNLWTEGCLLDSPPTTMTGTATSATPNKFHLNLNYMEKSNVGPMYITGERNSGIRIDAGSSTEGQLLLHGGLRSEGRNASTPTYGSAIRINGGRGTLRDVWTGYAMSSPSSVTARTDQGVIHIAGGEWLVDAGWYHRASGVAESVPYIYVASGAKARVRNIRTSGTWTGLPVVSGPGSIDADNSVTVV